MELRELIERISAEIIQAAADGDHERAGKLAELQGKAVAQINRVTVADGPTAAVSVPRPRRRLARIARHISTEALSAYERLALLFAEYRLIYVQSLAQDGSAI